MKNIHIRLKDVMSVVAPHSKLGERKRHQNKTGYNRAMHYEFHSWDFSAIRQPLQRRNTQAHTRPTSQILKTGV